MTDGPAGPGATRAVAWLDRFLPPTIDTMAADACRRARVVAAFGLALGVLAIVLSLGAAAMQLWDNVAGTLLGLPMAVTVLWLLRRGVSIAWLGVAAGVTLYLVALQGAIALGGAGTPPLAWLAAFPLFVVLVSGSRYGLAFAATSIAVNTAFYLTASTAPQISLTLRYFDGVAMILFVLALALAYERFKRRALDELEAVNLRLAAEMRERERVEADLRLAQKLDSVGRLAAGVAHEINTPVQYLTDTATFVREAYKDIIAGIEHQRRVTRAVQDGGDAQAVAAVVIAYEAEVDMPFLVAEIPESLDRMVDGLGRIARIVRSMQQLAHPMRQELSHVQLNEEIANTLAIAIHEYRDIAELETSYGELPPVRCRANEINQVVLDLVMNASHAIAEVVGETGARGTLAVTTRRDGDVVEVVVADSGRGIPTAIQDRIFDPFFTTKVVGRGFGQGLAVARSALERHGGTLTFETRMGGGTTFRARLPLG